MKSEEGRTKVSQNMVCTEKAVLGGEDVDALAECSDIACPDRARIAVNCEVKARLSEPVPGRGDDKGAVSAALCPHYDDCIAVRQRENNLHARCCFGNNA